MPAHLQAVGLHDGLQLGLQSRPQVAALLLLGTPKGWLLLATPKAWLLLGPPQAWLLVARVLLLGAAKSRVLLLGGAELRLSHARLCCTCRQHLDRTAMPDGATWLLSSVPCACRAAPCLDSSAHLIQVLASHLNNGAYPVQILVPEGQDSHPELGLHVQAGNVRRKCIKSKVSCRQSVCPAPAGQQLG